MKETPELYAILTTADGNYWLYKNGQMIVFESQQKHVPDPGKTYYDEISLKTSLKNRENIFAILLGYFGIHGFAHKSSGKAGLILSCQSDEKKFIGEASCKSFVSTVYGNCSHPDVDFTLAESNILYNAGKDIPGRQNHRLNEARFYLNGTIIHAWSERRYTVQCQKFSGISAFTKVLKWFSANPRMGDQFRISLSSPTVRGNILMLMVNSDSGFLLKVWGPEATSLHLGIQAKDYQKIRNSITPVWKYRNFKKTANIHQVKNKIPVVS